jgi:integrase
MADVRGADGERLRPTFSTQSAAEAWEVAARSAIETGKPIPETRTGLAPGKSATTALHTIGGLFDHVKRTEWSKLRSAETALKNGLDVVNYFGRNKEVSEITSADISVMKATFADDGLAPATVNRKASALSKMLHVAEEAGVIDKVPRIRWNQEMQTRFKYLDETEEAVLLAYWKAEREMDLHDLCVLLLDTGARCFTEMLPVRWDHFGPKRMTVTFWHTKGNEPRTVPVTQRCRQILEARKAAYPESLGPFSGVSHGGKVGCMVNESTMRHKWDAMRQFTGMMDVTPHTLRHTCCTRLTLGGVDVKRVMTWMGHKTITTTLRYMQIKPTGLEEILHVLEGRTKEAA